MSLLAAASVAALLIASPSTNDAEGIGGESFPPGTYACRPPGAVHGPFKSNRGCLLLEIHYYAE